MMCVGKVWEKVEPLRARAMSISRSSSRVVYTNWNSKWMDADQIRDAVHELFSKGDATILDYICGILEDEHFEFGEDGEEAYESIGPFLVRKGCAPAHGWGA